jgi:hypothetical protein
MQARRLAAFLALATLTVLTSLPAWAQKERLLSHNLGKMQAGQSYPFGLAAHNVNCEQLLDFRFEIRNTPWLHVDGEPVARNVPAGQTRTVPATIDLTKTPPGRYRGQVDVICENCGFWVFANCAIDKQVLTLVLEVTAPPQTATLPTPSTSAASPTSSTSTSTTPSATSSGTTSSGTAPRTAGRPLPPVMPVAGTTQRGIDPSCEAFLTPEQAAKLKAARDAAGRAVAAAEKAADDEEKIKKRKRRCEEELEALQASADAAAQAAAAAAQAAQSAQAAANAAQAQLAAYQQDLKAAEQKMNDTYKTLQMQAGYRSIVAKESGTNSARYAEAQQLVDAANDAAAAAQKAYLAVKGSLAQRQAEADAANKAAKEANEKAATAQAEADAAAAALKAKQLECLGLAAEADKAEAATDAAQDAAGAAQNAAGRAQDEAEGQARANQEDEIAKKKKKCEDCWKELAQLLDDTAKTLKALAALGQLDPNKASVDVPSLADVIRDTALAMAGTAANVSDMGAGTLLGALQAAYGIAQIYQSMMTPGTMGSAHVDDSQRKNWLQEHGHAADPKQADRVLRNIDQYMSSGRNVKFMEDRINRLRAECLRCEQELKQMQSCK